MRAQELYALAWLSFGIVHSLLATTAGREWLVRVFGAYHRVAYNVIAVVHFGAILVYGRWLFVNHLAFVRPIWLYIVLSAMVLGGVIIIAIALLRDYDLGRFTGLAQVRAGRAGATLAEDEPLRFDGLHRYVRHPLYTGGFLVLWGLAHDPMSVATAVWASLYLMIGTWFEERRLLRVYGDAYKQYRLKVPAFMPWGGRAH
jgi:protein-S-isoprenylcysteine O-methyltransferase Ste14